MAKVSKVQHLVVETPDKVGMMAKVCGAISDAGVNIRAISAIARQRKGRFLILTEDNAKAKEALKSSGFKVKEEAAVAVELENEVGSAKKMAQKLADAKVNLKYCYGSIGNGTIALLVFNSSNNEKAVRVLAEIGPGVGE